MRREAHLVENEWVKGEWQSELVYAILDREWSLNVHHLGIAVDDLDAAIATYARALRRDARASRGARRSGGRGGLAARSATGRIELLAPAAARHAGRAVPRERGPGMHHVAFEVDDRRRRARAAAGRRRPADRRNAAARPVRAAGRVRSSGGDRRRSGRVGAAMTDTDRIRIEIAFDGQQVLSVLVHAADRRRPRPRARRRPRRRLLVRGRGRPLHRVAAARRLREALRRARAASASAS